MVFSIPNKDEYFRTDALTKRKLPTKQSYHEIPIKDSMIPHPQGPHLYYDPISDSMNHPVIHLFENDKSHVHHQDNYEMCQLLKICFFNRKETNCWILRKYVSENAGSHNFCLSQTWIYVQKDNF